MAPSHSKFDFAFRFLASFVMLASHLLLIIGAIGYVIASSLHLNMTGLAIETAILGIPTLVALIYLFKMVWQAESDPANL